MFGFSRRCLFSLRTTKRVNDFQRLHGRDLRLISTPTSSSSQSQSAFRFRFGVVSSCFVAILFCRNSVQCESESDKDKKNESDKKEDSSFKPKEYWNAFVGALQFKKKIKFSNFFRENLARCYLLNLFLLQH